MTAYILRRLLLIIPTLFAIMLINFLIIQAAPGGPVEQIIGDLTGQGAAISERVTRGGGGEIAGGTNRGGRAARQQISRRPGSRSRVHCALNKQFGFDRPLPERFFMMLKNYVFFDFGESYFRNRRVVDLVLEKMPVSISLGLWTTLLTYLISIPLGIMKAVRDGSRFE